jgi:hypothetical protein
MIIFDILLEIISSWIEKDKYIHNTKKALKYTGIIIVAMLIVVLILMVLAILLFIRYV